MNRLRSDVEALSAMTRGSASPGERASAEWIAGRLREAGASDVHLETFRYQGTYAGAHALHVAAGLVAARRGGVLGAALAAGALASLELEASGRAQWVRRVLPASEGTNVVARLPAAEERRATLVLLAHHDAARTGLGWDPRLVGLGAKPGRMSARMGPIGVALTLAAVPWRPVRRLASVLLWLALASYADVATSPTVPGANDNATGVAALLALAERLAAEPARHVEVLLLVPGCEESGMGGTAAYLRTHDVPAGSVVLSLDTLGCGTPIVVEAEGALLPRRYRGGDLALAEAGGRRAGVPGPERWRVGAWTDAILARFAGLRAISLLSVGPDGIYTNWHLPTDTADRVDFGCVRACAAIAGGIVEEVAENVS
jgi:acetylornithine deacetylase/succinyl-diaminopimelate desuccinylase-like protein